MITEKLKVETETWTYSSQVSEVSLLEYEYDSTTPTKNAKNVMTATKILNKRLISRGEELCVKQPGIFHNWKTFRNG